MKKLGKTANGRQMSRMEGPFGIGANLPPFAVVNDDTGEIELEDGTRAFLEIGGQRLQGFIEVSEALTLPDSIADDSAIQKGNSTKSYFVEAKECRIDLTGQKM